VGERGEVWERHDGRWAATGERGRYLSDKKLFCRAVEFWREGYTFKNSFRNFAMAVED